MLNLRNRDIQRAMNQLGGNLRRVVLTPVYFQDTQHHFSRFIGEVPGFESDFFKSSPFPPK